MGGVMQATSYVLVSVRAGKARQVFQQLQKLKCTYQVDAISGPYDIVAIVQGADFDDIGRTVMDRIQTIEGVEKSLTCNVIRFEI